jgi:hypothetical protein
MWLIIKNKDNTVFQIENIRPPDGAYKKKYFSIKYWDGPTPRKEGYDLDTGEIIPGDKDPTLALDVDEKRRLALVEECLDLFELIDLMLDYIMVDLNGELSGDTKNKAKSLKDKLEKIKDKYPKSS